MSEQTRQDIRKFPAARGLAWVTGSLALMKRQAVRLLLISLFFQLFLSLSQADVLGLLVILCLPVLSAGMLHAFYTVDCGLKPSLAVLFMPFTASKGLGRLLLLGGFVLLLGILVVSLILAGQVTDIDTGVLSRIEGGDIEALQLIDPQLIENAIMAMAIGAAVSGTISYFSVPLIWFKKRAVGGAVTSGLAGLARNWRPLLVVGLILGLLAVPVGLLFSFFYLSVLSGAAASSWLAILMLFAGPIFQLLLFGTQYLAFRDIFDLEIAAEGGREQQGDQLVA